MRPTIIDTKLEDAIEDVGRTLRGAEQALTSVDVAERTGRPIHVVRQALRFLVDEDLVHRLGRREGTYTGWSTQFYYSWLRGRVSEQSAMGLRGVG